MIHDLLFPNVLDVILLIIFLLFGDRLSRDSQEWLEGFIERQEYERWLMSELEELYERLGEWKDVADQIDRGEHPYNNLNDEFTLKFGQFARGMIQHIEWQIAKLR